MQTLRMRKTKIKDRQSLVYLAVYEGVSSVVDLGLSWGREAARFSQKKWIGAEIWVWFAPGVWVGPSEKEGGFSWQCFFIVRSWS